MEQWRANKIPKSSREWVGGTSWWNPCAQVSSSVDLLHFLDMKYMRWLSHGQKWRGIKSTRHVKLPAPFVLPKHLVPISIALFICSLLSTPSVIVTWKGEQGWTRLAHHLPHISASIAANPICWCWTFAAGSLLFSRIPVWFRNPFFKFTRLLHGAYLGRKSSLLQTFRPQYLWDCTNAERDGACEGVKPMGSSLPPPMEERPEPGYWA